MADEKFAFESEEVSIAFSSISGSLGDVLIAKSVFNAIVELVPNCKIDFYHVNAATKSYVEAFYGDSKNLNAILPPESYMQHVQKYDAAVRVWQMILIDYVNVARLQQSAPKLLKALDEVEVYNKKYIYNTNDAGIVLRNITRAHILGTNRYTCLSYGGALPIRNNRVSVPLSPEAAKRFQALGLNKNYITIGSNAGNNSDRHSLKEWPTDKVTEYISLLNMYLPQAEVVQVGGGGAEIIANADRHIIDADLELVKHVLKNSLLHVDCESGLVHLATQLGTKCLVLFGPTDEKYYGYKENLNIVSDVCRPCVWAWDDGSTCLRGATEPPCMAFSPQLICEVTCNYINHLALKNNA